MLTTIRPHTTAADLLRLLAVWLAFVLLAQGLAAAWAMGAGPRHHHIAAVAHQQLHDHAAAERHHHVFTDSTVVADPELAAALDAAAVALATALALIASATMRRWADPRRHERPTTRTAVRRGILLPPPLQPPRPA